MDRFVGYIRVSTAAQGQTGLGLAAQREAIVRFVKARNGELVGLYEEVVSGRSDKREELNRALRHCRQRRASLVVAKLDRFARNVRTIAEMLDSNVEFVACDMPDANRLTLHILGAIAEYERDMVSTRTKAALQEVKAQGRPLGNPAIKELQPVAARAAKTAADDFARQAFDYMKQFDPDGGLSPSGLAAFLNSSNYRTPRGKTWHTSTATNLIKRWIELGLRSG